MIDLNELTEKLNRDEFKDHELDAIFNEGLPTLVEKGDIKGVNQIINLIEQNRHHWNSSNSAIQKALNHRDPLLSNKLVQSLHHLYDPSSVNYQLALTRVIRRGQVENSKVLLNKTKLVERQYCLSFIIARYGESNDNELKDNLISIFEHLSSFTPDGLYKKVELYNQILQHNSLYFIDYFCKKYPSTVTNEKNLFRTFLLGKETTNEMISKLLASGASLAWLSSDDWKIIIEAHKEAFDRNKENTHSILSITKPDNINIKDYIPCAVVKSFAANTVEVMLQGIEHETSDANTLLLLLNKSLIDANDLYDIICMMIEDKSQIHRPAQLIYEQIKVATDRMQVLLIKIAIKLRCGIDVFQKLTDDDRDSDNKNEQNRKNIALFLKVGQKMDEFYLTDYISVNHEAIEIFMNS